MSDTEWSKELTAAYRKWLFTGPEGDLDTTDEDWLSDLQERAFEGGWLAALATTGGETEWGLRDNETGHVTDWRGRNYAANVDHRDFPGYTVVTRTVPPWLPWVAVDPTSPETTEEQSSNG